LKDRRVTVVREGQAPEAAAALAPKADIRNLAIASDHTGIALRQAMQGERHVRLSPRKK
jgi:hypothetical protein